MVEYSYFSSCYLLCSIADGKALSFIGTVGLRRHTTHLQIFVLAGLKVLTFTKYGLLSACSEGTSRHLNRGALRMDRSWSQLSYSCVLNLWFLICIDLKVELIFIVTEILRLTMNRLFSFDHTDWADQDGQDVADLVEEGCCENGQNRTPSAHHEEDTVGGEDVGTWYHAISRIVYNSGELQECLIAVLEGKTETEIEDAQGEQE